MNLKLKIKNLLEKRLKSRFWFYFISTIVRFSLGQKKYLEMEKFPSGCEKILTSFYEISCELERVKVLGQL